MERLILACTILMFFLSCYTENGNSYQSPYSFEVTQTAEIILSVEADEIIANPTRITSFDDGFVLYDDALKQIHIFSEDGDHFHTFGREGRGPGEFQSVSTLMVDEDQLIVSDSELLRLTGFDFEGNVLSNHELTASLFAIDNAVLSPSKFITPTNGQEGGLAKYVDPINDFERVFGEPVTTTPETADFNQWNRDLSSGKVPDFFRNRVAVSGDESYFYLFLQTEGILQQYSVGGELNWKQKFELAEFQDEFDHFIEQNRDNSPGRMYMLQYVHKMEQNDNGVYMLLRIPERYPPTILFIDHDGEKQLKFTFSNVESRPSDFSISPNKDWIYFLNTSRGIVYRSSFPE